MPAGGSLARTAINFQTGSCTPLNQLFSSAVVIIVLMFLTPFFYYTPLFILASIVIVGAISVLSVQEIKFLWKTREKGDLTEMLITMLATALAGPIIGTLPENSAFVTVVRSRGSYFTRCIRICVSFCHS